MIRRGFWLVATLCALALPSSAQHVVVGRADADASGGWPVALWVIDGDRNHVIVRAPRQRLGPLRWRRADAAALMQLEHFGAPKLRRLPEEDPCPAEPSWGEAVLMDDGFHPGERLELAHPACAAGDCKGAAWRVDLPRTLPEALPIGAPSAVLPLVLLLPDLARDSPEWLVLYVVSRAEFLALKEVPQLSAADAMRGPRSQAQWSQRYRLPADAAAGFPAIHQALLEQAAMDQGLAQASVLMRSESVSLVQSPGFVGGREVGDAQRRALGLAADSVRGHHIVRLLLRLTPADRPRELHLEVGSDERFVRLEALELRPETLASCYSRLLALNCEAVCKRRQETMAAEERLPACIRSCRQLKNPSDAVLVERLEELAERQRQARRWVEQMTGRPASSWPAR